MLPFSLDADKTDFSMRQHSLPLWIVFIVGGVFGVDEVPVSVMEGDSVTLISGVTEIQKKEELKWKINDGVIIANIDKENNIFSVPGNQESFKGRLKLNETTGSLTITNISTNDTRDYKLQIDSTIEGEPKIFKVTVNGVPVVDKDGEKSVSVSVMEGDSVTLHTGFTPIDNVKWMLGKQDLKPTDDQTGDLTINVTGRSQREDYLLEINNSKIVIRRKYFVLIDGVKKETVKEGNPVNLHTGFIELEGYDLILSKTADVIVAKINKSANKFLPLDKHNMRFGGRLELVSESGDLIIHDSKTTDSGDYNLQMNSSTHSLQRTISVTVNNSGVSPGAVAGIVVGLLVFHWCLQL